MPHATHVLVCCSAGVLSKSSVHTIYHCDCDMLRCILGNSMPGGSSGALGKTACQAEPSHSALNGSLEKGSPAAFSEGSSSSPCTAHAALPK